MADEVKKRDTARHVSEDERFKFIGFEVYPGKPKDLFASDAEKAQLVDRIREKREKGHVTREECTLFEDRVSRIDRLVLTLASVVILVSLFVPWFSVYNEIVEKPKVTQTSEAAPVSGSMTADAAPADQTPIGQPTEAQPAGAQQSATQQVSESEEVIHGYVAKPKVRREYTTVSGLGVLMALGSAGSVAFSSGLALMLSALLLLCFVLLCIVLPVYTLYAVWMAKGSADDRALFLKKVLRYNWVFLMIFGALLFLSFLGGDYSRPVAQQFASLGDSYSVGVLFGMLSWGIFLVLAASILAAAKGSEI